MSIERDQSTRHQMRSGITGENVLRPLDEFSVTPKVTDGESVIASQGGFWELFIKKYYGPFEAS